MEMLTASVLLQEFRSDFRQLDNKIETLRQDVRSDIRHLDAKIDNTVKWTIGTQFLTMGLMLGTIIPILLYIH